MNDIYTWIGIGLVVFSSVAGDVLLSKAMKQVGDVAVLRRRMGVMKVVARVVSNSNFLFGLLTMTISFYSLLYGLSWGDLSLVAPAAASLTFVGNAVAARIFLHEKVDTRRWIAALLVAGGVALMAV
ncbi:MAG TPA: EamA family transporter [Terriglobales bacterium]|nr:EamA family transporter [Terriglobales bacterium]